MTALSHLGAVCTQTLSSQLRYSVPAHIKMMVLEVSVQPNGWCSKKIRMRNAVALSQLISLVHFLSNLL